VSASNGIMLTAIRARPALSCQHHRSCIHLAGLQMQCLQVLLRQPGVSAVGSCTLGLPPAVPALNVVCITVLTEDCGLTVYVCCCCLSQAWAFR
jgi:hypothetical protein